MAGGYEPPTADDFGAIGHQLTAIWVRLRELERPTGTQIGSLADQVQTQFSSIDTRVAASVSTQSYTRTQVDTKIASPGDIHPGNVTATGTISATGTITTEEQVTAGSLHVNGDTRIPQAYDRQVTGQCKTVWMDSTGWLGFSSSKHATKKDLTPLPTPLTDALLACTVYVGRFVWDEPDSPVKVFLLAEDVAAAGYGPDVVPTGEDGEPDSINYSQLVVPLLAIAQQQEARLKTLEHTVKTLTRTTKD